jgi:glyoxylase-like metal-dependent hydrolase (beta-lactamase superfamily II)
MNLLEQELQYPLGDTLPAPGASLELAPGVRWIRMGLPFALDHINLWLLRDRLDGREGWTVVDCCIAHDASRAQWEQVFANELGGLPVLRVIATHMHPDHIGLAHWICERWSTPENECRLWISATDYHAARLASQSTTAFGGDGAARFFAAHGMTDLDALEKIRGRANYFPSLVPALPPRYRRMQDGDLLSIGGRSWRCISGYGHAPEHIALYCEDVDVLISGDMVLPRISTNVSVIDLEPEANPLPLYLASIGRMLALPAQTLVLPSHGKPFRGLHTRVAQLVAHHDERFADLMAACTKAPQTAASLLPVLFRRPLDLHQTTFAMGESIAHLHALWLRGELRRELGEDGVLRFSPA